MEVNWVESGNTWHARRGSMDLDQATQDESREAHRQVEAALYTRVFEKYDLEPSRRIN